MEIKKNSGLAGIDMVIAIIAIAIFSTLIISMMYSNVLENVKLKKETLAMIYITEIFENVGIQDYDVYDYLGLTQNYKQITEPNVLVPQEIIDNYTVEMKVITQVEGETYTEDILKNIGVKLTYEIGDKTYSCTMERRKIKE